jgi:GTP-binding protein LepA
VAHLLDEIVRQLPPPTGGEPNSPVRAMIFDSVYDVYRGVITYVRVIDGRIEARDRIKMMSTGAVHELLELGVISPEPIKAGALGVGEVGYLMTGVKDVRQSRVGDTDHDQLAAREEGAGRLQRSEADGLFGPVPDRRL